MPTDLIPARFRNATTDLPEVDQWCSAVLSGNCARLLLLGAVAAGKTHTAYAAFRRLLTAGYPADRIVAYQSYDLVVSYQPSRIDQAPPVVLLDDLTTRVDRSGIHEPDEPEIQALMAAQQGALVDAAERLVSSQRSWIFCGSTADRVGESLGDDLIDRIVAIAEAVELPPRRPGRPATGR